MNPEYKQNMYLPGIHHQDFRQSEEPWMFPPDGGNIKWFVYELTTDVTIGEPSTATADLYDKDDETVLIQSDIEWVGNATIFDDQVEGDRGTCLKIGNKAYAVNAACDNTGGEGGGDPATGVHIGPTPPADTTNLWIDTSGL